MYKKYITDKDSYFATAQTLPANTSAFGDEGAKFSPSDAGAIEIVVRAKTACALADTKKLYLELYTAASESGTYSLFSKLEITADGAQSWAVGDKILIFPVPTDLPNNWVKVKIGTDDAAASGTIDIFKHYVGR